MESVWSVSKLSTKSVGSRRGLVANCVHTADADATKQFRRVGVGGVYWALVSDGCIITCFVTDSLVFRPKTEMLSVVVEIILLFRPR